MNCFSKINYTLLNFKIKNNLPKTQNNRSLPTPAKKKLFFLLKYY